MPCPSFPKPAKAYYPITLRLILFMIPLLISSLLAVPAEIINQVNATTAESSYAIARLIMSFVNWTLDMIGQESNPTLYIWLYAISVFGFAFLVGYAIKWIVVWTIGMITPHLKSNIYAQLAEKHLFSRICNIIPPLIFLILIQFTLYAHASVAYWLSKFCWIYIVIIIAMSLTRLTDVIWARIDERANKRKLPLNGLVQLLKLIIWIFATVIISAVMLNKSPGALLAGIGVFASVLMLIFKDSILGVVAGVQLSENDSLHVGDWISIPGSEANGTVTEVSLTAVKILNWDKTTSTVAPYNLITNGFKNYRSMQESNTRRIQRSYMIDADSVVETTSEMLEELSRIPLMKEWIARKLEQRHNGKEEDVKNSAGLADGTIDTNLGMFRAYVMMYLTSNKYIDRTSDCFVTTLAQQGGGIPLQVYCFTNTSSWIPYEGIQALVFEHLAVMLYRFHLYTFENPSGHDTIIDGYLSPGKNPANVFGLPYPFFTDSGTPMNPGIPSAGSDSSPNISSSKPG